VPLLSLTKVSKQCHSARMLFLLKFNFIFDSEIWIVLLNTCYVF
jgi:hypothetical protein